MTDCITIDMRYRGLDIGAEVYLGARNGDDDTIERAFVMDADGTDHELNLERDETLYNALIQRARDQQGDEDDKADTWDKTK